LSIYSEEAVDYGELETFLRLNEIWDEHRLGFPAIDPLVVK
jgi:hypothetical protein